MEFEKFRETIIDPFKIEFKSSIQIENILNYPHAGNDVFHCIGLIEGERKEFILKISRHSGSDFKNESFVLSKLKDSAFRIPGVTEYGISQEKEYLCLEKLPGKRIEFILDQYKSNYSSYCREIGKSLADIHSLELDVGKAQERKFHKIPECLEYNSLKEICSWLVQNKPPDKQLCFIHGDHHYANLLWKDGEISGVLDWELSGIGNREFDLAWAFFVRSSALYRGFLCTQEEEDEILQGYSTKGEFIHSLYKYYKVQILSHLYTGKSISENYKSWIESEFLRITGIKL